ncbi:MAG: ATP-binding protein [Pseudomonadota bacterium]
MPDPLIHLVVGGTGAGKSTYSSRLADEIGGLRFSIDPWMMQLYWKDSPAEPDFDWAIERVTRCVDQMCEVAGQAASRGMGSVFDVGFTTQENRSQVADFAISSGISAKLHWIDVDPDTRWARVQQRNREQGETFAFAVTRDMFDFMETLWEPPTEQEMARLRGVKA